MRRTIIPFLLAITFLFLSSCSPDSTTSVETKLSKSSPVTEKVYGSVTFDPNGGTYVEPIKAEYLTYAPTTTRENYLFLGWYRNQSLTDEVIYPLEISQDITLYAKWLLLESYVECSPKKIKAMDSSLSDSVYYSLTPTGFDFTELERRGYYISISVSYDVRYTKEYDVPFDLGYFGSPKYNAWIINTNHLGTGDNVLSTPSSYSTRTIYKQMTISQFNNEEWYLYFATENIQNIVYFKNISIEFKCFK